MGGMGEKKEGNVEHADRSPRKKHDCQLLLCHLSSKERVNVEAGGLHLHLI